MSRHVEVGAMRVDIAAAVAATAVVLGLGVFLGATVLGEPAAEPHRPLESAQPTVPHVAPAPTLQASAHATALEQRLRAVEEAIQELRTAQASGTERLRPALEDYEQLKRGGGLLAGPGGPGEPAAVGPMVSERAATGDKVRELARALGLDATRSAAMAAQVAQTTAQLESLEQAHAEVTREGSVTTIKIGKYGDQASGPIQRLRDWVDRSLTPQEKEAYERDRSESRLLGLRAGLFERTVRIDETGGVIQFKETIATKDGPMDVMQGTAPAQARLLVLEQYAHLLPATPER